MRVRAVVSYDGTSYSGFQRQLNAPTVQEALETALAEVTQEPVTLLAAGRTDAGVHAVGQVVAFDTMWGRSEADLQRAMNAVLPHDVAVRQVRRAEPGFHPRYDALSRLYRYRIYDAAVRSPIGRRYSLHVPYPLDRSAMEQAARSLVGTHDFATFGQPPQGEVTVRRVFRAEWSREPCGLRGLVHGQEAGSVLAFDIEANAFLYRMVRSIVGTLLDVGQGRMSLKVFEDAFTSGERSAAGKTAAPHGLILVRVNY